MADKIRCREIWVNGSFKHNNPDNDLPDDFESNKKLYFDELALHIDIEVFVEKVKENLTKALNNLNDNVPKNPHVKVSSKTNGRIVLTPLSPQSEPHHINRLRPVSELMIKYLQRIASIIKP